MSADKDKQERLLADIESFSVAGVPSSKDTVADEASKKPRRGTSAFPDLSIPPEPIAEAPAEEAETEYAQPISTAGCGLLDRLRKEAELASKSSGASQNHRTQLNKKLNSVMVFAFNYLSDVIRQLNVIQPAIGKDFPLQGNIVYTGLKWQDGFIGSRSIPDAAEERLLESITVNCKLASAEKLSVRRDAPMIASLENLLQEHKLSFSIKEQRNALRKVEAATFDIPCEIKANFVIKADYETQTLSLRTNNLYRFGVMMFPLTQEQLNQEAIDELIKLVLGESGNFLKMFRRSS